jgi:NAD(P)H dehydrogenase (quinone)
MEDPMANTRILVTSAGGKVGNAVALQLLEKGIKTRALVHRENEHSARLRDLGAEVVVADMFDYQQVQAAMDGVNRVYFHPIYHPHALDSTVIFAIAARRAGVEAMVQMGQWLASPDHHSIGTRQAWLTDQLFQMLPDTAHVAVLPGYFADNYLKLIPLASQLGLFPFPTGGGLNAPPSNEDIARVAVGALLDPHRHDGQAYRPTGPTLMSGADIATAMGEALGRKVRHIELPIGMFMRAVKSDAKRLNADMFFQSSLRLTLPEQKLGSWAEGGPTTHVRDVAGVEPEDFVTIARRYAASPSVQRNAGNFARELLGFMKTTFELGARLDRFDRLQQHPRVAHPLFAGQSDVWRNELSTRWGRDAAPTAPATSQSRTTVS